MWRMSPGTKEVVEKVHRDIPAARAEILKILDAQPHGFSPRQLIEILVLQEDFYETAVREALLQLLDNDDVTLTADRKVIQAA